MSKYISRPVEVEAWTFSGSFDQAPEWVLRLREDGVIFYNQGRDAEDRDVPILIQEAHRPNYSVGCRVGWLIVRDPDGNGAYPCAPDVFEKKYAEKREALGTADSDRAAKVMFWPEQFFDFGQAIKWLKDGQRVARAGWNGKGMWLAYSPGSLQLPSDRFWAGRNREYAQQIGGFADVLPCITMKTATGEILMGWLASQSDMLAEDWEIVT